MSPAPLLSFFLIVAATAVAADPRLDELLRRYPDADTNRDGTLSLEEAQAYAKKVRRGKGDSAAGPSSTAAEDSGAARPGARKPAPTHADVAYGPHERQVFDLWLAPATEGPSPLVVYIHGGGFVQGSKAGASADMISGCLAEGVSFMAINYRFRPGTPIQDILRDCARSIQFVRSRASDYRLDPARIAVYGGSAGAGSSLWLAFRDDLADPANPDPVLRQSSRVVAAGAVNAQATYDLLRWREVLGQDLGDHERPGETASFYGARSADDLTLPAFQAIRRDTDMLAHISKDDPPVFLFTSHPGGPIGNRGHLLHHPDHARAVKARCDELGIPARLHFALEEPRLAGDYQRHLRDFLLERLKR